MTADSQFAPAREDAAAGDPLADARVAYEVHAWADASRRFAVADEDGDLSAADLEAYGEAVWWMGRLEDAIAIRERAYRDYLRDDDHASAARVALWLFMDYAGRLQFTLARGALARAERQLADEPEGPVHAQLAAMQALSAGEQGDYDRALELGREAQAIGVRHRDGDLESLGLLIQGRTLVDRGDVSEGFAKLDHATTAAVGGELSAFTTGVVYCATISTCTQLADYRRAGEWTEAAERWCHQEAMESGFPGACRVYRAEIKRFQGEWTKAEEEARRAAIELADSFLDVAGAAHNEVGELRLRMGDLEAAEEAFRSAHEAGHDAQPGLSLLRLAQGRLEVAASSIRGAVLNPYLQPLARARLLPAQVEIALAVGDVDTAAEAAEQLRGIADTYRGDSPVFEAQAKTARAGVALARGEATAALADAQEALRRWREARAPYEVARIRMLLARIHERLGDQDTAAVEAQSARRTFERLHAKPDLRRATELLSGRDAERPTERTLLFSDIVTSTSLLEAMGDRAWADVVRWHDRTLREEFAAHGGEEVDHAGDGFFVAFPSASAAIACAVAIQRRLDDHRREHGFAPAVRIGVHTAEALKDGAGYRGKGVHEAARIGALAGAGEILASRATLDAVGGAVAARETRAVSLEGISDPVEIAGVPWTDAPP